MSSFEYKQSDGLRLLVKPPRPERWLTRRFKFQDGGMCDVGKVNQCFLANVCVRHQ